MRTLGLVFICIGIGCCIALTGIALDEDAQIVRLQADLDFEKTMSARWKDDAYRVFRGEVECLYLVHRMEHTTGLTPK